MAPYTHPAPVRSYDTEASGPTALSRTIRSAGRAIRRFADAFSGSCRRIRAYNELANLSPQALQDIGYRRDELDRVIAGEVPHRKRHEPFADAYRTDIP
ncbi:MAG: DUF1127 domain-containing protein [Alphaproteobacteria bacterium]